MQLHRYRRRAFRRRDAVERGRRTLQAFARFSRVVEVRRGDHAFRAAGARAGAGGGASMDSRAPSRFLQWLANQLSNAETGAVQRVKVCPIRGASFNITNPLAFV